MVFDEGRNCWQSLRTDQLGFLIDGEAYFSAVAKAFLDAKHTIFILAWDIHSSTVLKIPGTDRQMTLVQLLAEICERRPQLRVYILAWDFFSPIYSFEREPLQRVRFGLLRKKRINFLFDHHHPIIGCLHQKVVVVDDSIAFCGGLDITVHRWDTTEHDPLSNERTTPDGRPYPPFHDVQIVTNGEAAVSLGALARDRWLKACGVDIPLSQEISSPDLSSYVPSHLLLSNPNIAISRTYASYRHQKECREVEHLYVDMITFARRYIYIENQYFTSHRISQSLAESLAQTIGPEVVIVLPRDPGGWLEESTIGSRQARTLKMLVDADKHKRLSILYPHDSRIPKHEYKTVHAKVMICDGILARVGSANLNNRSMGLDSECDVAVDCTKDLQGQEVIRNFLACLLADHTGAEWSEARTLLSNADASLLRVVDSLNNTHRYKGFKDFQIPGELEAAPKTIQDVDLMDMENPIPIERKIDDWGYLHERITKRFGLFHIRASFWLTALVVIGILYVFAHSSLFDFVRDGRLLKITEDPYSPMNLLSVGLLFSVATLFFIPINIVIIMVVSFYPTLAALGYILYGTAVGATSGYICGFLLRTKLIRSFIGRRSRKVLARIGEGKLWALILIRILPVAPNSLINYVAGMSHMKFSKFLLGTVIGILPGALLLTFLQRNLLDFVMTRDLKSLVFSALVVLAVIVVYRWARIRFSSYLYPAEE
ncbi:MAG: VTT domain-containing protein [Oligoflexales bacterium]